MKKALTLSLAALLALSLFAGCTQDKQTSALPPAGSAISGSPDAGSNSADRKDDTNTQQDAGVLPDAGVTNPVSQVASADAFSALNLTLSAPENAENVTYYIIADEIAEVRFDVDGVSYTARASSKISDHEMLSGIYGTWTDSTLADGISYYMVDDSYSVASFTKDTVTYTVSAPYGTEALETIAAALAK